MCHDQKEKRWIFGSEHKGCKCHLVSQWALYKSTLNPKEIHKPCVWDKGRLHTGWMWEWIFQWTIQTRQTQPRIEKWVKTTKLVKSVRLGRDLQISFTYCSGTLLRNCNKVFYLMTLSQYCLQHVLAVCT